MPFSDKQIININTLWFRLVGSILYYKKVLPSQFDSKCGVEDCRFDEEVEP